MYVYQKFKQGGDLPTLYSVGFFIPNGNEAPYWISHEDFTEEADAAWRIHFLNGGSAVRDVGVDQANPAIVKVRVSGGVVQDVETPAGVVVKVFDYDFDDRDVGDLDHDEDGDECNITTFGEAK